MEERISVINQITQNIASMNDNSPSNVQTATFHVRPEHWGEMKITVKITDDGNTGKMRGVEAVLTTSSESARQVLLQNTSELRKSLEEHGMKLDKLDIVVSPSGATQTSSSQTVAQSAHTDQSTGQSFQSASAFTQGGGSGNHSQGSGSGQGQTNANPSHLSARTASPTQATMHVASTTAGPSKGSNRLVDYRI
jgi:flagellar hook-length control protein FliK